jgi:hypothetical protein
VLAAGLGVFGLELLQVPPAHARASCRWLSSIKGDMLSKILPERAQVRRRQHHAPMRGVKPAAVAGRIARAECGLFHTGVSTSPQPG